MQSTLTPDEADPHDIFVIDPDVVLAARADRPLAEQPTLAKASPDRAPANLAEDIMGDILSRPSTPKLRVVPDISVAAPLPPGKPVPPVDTKFRATAATADTIANDINAPGPINVPGDIHRNGAQPSGSSWVKRATVAFLFALASVAAAEGWDRYGDTARQILTAWTPALTLPSSPPANTTSAAVPAAPPAVQTAAGVDQAPASPAPSAAQSVPDAAIATPAAAPPSAQALKSMTRDLADMGQQIEALKASIAQLKAGQEKMTEQMAQQIQRDIVRNAVARTESKPVEARTTEHPRVLGAPPRPLQPPSRKPQTAYVPPPPTAAAMNVPPPYPSRPSPVAAPAPMQTLPPVESEAPDGGPVVRPPMPLH